MLRRRKMRVVIVCLLTLISLNSSIAGQPEKKKVITTFEIGSSTWAVPQDFYIMPYRFTGNVNGFDAIPVNEFTTEDRSRALSRGSLYLSTSFTKKFVYESNASIEIGLGQIQISGNGVDKLRYTDMIDSDRGFVLASSYVADRYEHTSRYLCVKPKLLFPLDFWGREHEIGIGLYSYVLLGSSYSLYLHHGTTNEKYFYKTNDLKISDWIWQVVPETTYQLKVIETDKIKCKLKVALAWRSAHFMQLPWGRGSNATYNAPIWSYGIQLERKTQSQKEIK